MNIDTKNAILYVDTICYECKRLVAYTNTVEYDGRRYCHRCDEKLRPLAKMFLTQKEG